ncbi:MAG: hypothetical protein R3B06_04950 [Kofleriaceae bacterium]
MSVRWLDAPAQRAFADAVEAIEAGSAAEVVIAVRRSARRWLHVPFLVGAAAAWIGLAFMLYADHTFALPSFLIDPLVVGLAAGLASTVAPPLVRWLTPRAVRQRAVEAEARATFVARGVHQTQGRTGILVYCALAERCAAVITDVGVAAAVTPDAVAAARDAIAQAIAAGGVATAARIAALAPALALALPRADDDVNELPDALDHDLVRRPRS